MKLTERSLFWLALACASGVLLAYGWPLLGGMVYVNGDLGRLHLPLRQFFAQALERGTSYIWCPWEFSGFYLHGEGQGMLYHPLNYLAYWLLPLSPAFAIELVRNYVFSWLGMWLFLGRHIARWDAAALGALLFAFCSFNFMHYQHLNVVGIAAHAPWALLAIHLAVRSRHAAVRVGALIALTGITTSQHLLSHPPTAWLAMLVEGAYASFLLGPALIGRDPARPPGSALFALLTLAGALLMSFLVAAAQLLPLWDALTLSYRGEPPVGYSNRLAMHPINLVQLVGPYTFQLRVIGTLYIHELALYCGAIAPVLATWVLMRRRALGRLWPLAGASLAFAGVGLWLAMGSQAGLYRLHEMLPVVGLFRIPGRFVLFTQIGLAIASAVAFADLLSLARQDRPRAAALWPLAIPLAFSLLATGWLLTGPMIGPWGDPLLEFERVAEPYPAPLGSAWQVAAGPLLLALATGLVVALARGHLAAAAGMLVFAAVDLGAYGLSYVALQAPVDPQVWMATPELPELSPGARLNTGPPKLMTRETRMASGYASMTPDRILPLGQGFPPGKGTPSFRNALRVASVEHAFGERVEGALPRARLLTRAVVSDDIYREIGSVDVATTAMLSVPLELEPAAPGTAAITRDLAGDIVIETRAPTRQLLVLSESYHPGWRATRGEQPCEIHRVYGDYMGCVVPAGAHRVAFAFEPDSLAMGLRVSALALVATFAWLALGIWRGLRSAD